MKGRQENTRQEIFSGKPTLVQLLNRHHITMPKLAQAARLSLGTVRAMAQNQPMQPIVAQQVLSGLFRLTGVCYRLEDVDVALIPPTYVVGSIHVSREDLEVYPTPTMNDMGR